MTQLVGHPSLYKANNDRLISCLYKYYPYCRIMVSRTRYKQRCRCGDRILRSFDRDNYENVAKKQWHRLTLCLKCGGMVFMFQLT